MLAKRVLFLALITATLSLSSLIRCETKPESAYKKLIVVLLMVKNEESVIVPTLETYLSQNARESKEDNEEVAYFLYDTGSTDETVKKTKEFFEKYKIKNYQIVQEPFINFGESRSRGLTLVREKYPESTFILFPDAEWYMQNFDELIGFCKQEDDKYSQGGKAPPYYRVRLERSDYSMPTPRLILTHDTVVFELPTQECPTKRSGANAPRTIYFKLGVSREGQEASKRRWYRDIDWLVEYLIKHPKNDRAVFYTGLTHKWLGIVENNLTHYREAYSYLKVRATTMSIFPEEDYYAYFNLGDVTAKLAEAEVPGFTWEEAMKYLLQAYTLRPHRAEPLVKIARHYLNLDNHALSYLFIRRACDLPFPDDLVEILPIQPHAYNFDRWEIMSRSAWYMKDYERGEMAAKKAIEASPNSAHLYRNLACYWERKSK